MKRTIQIFSILILMLALATATAFAHTEIQPFSTDLVAGGGNIKSAMDIGDVLVWNDGEFLYVKYVIADNEWCLTETHLEIALVLGDIPQTKKFNPIPGMFTYTGYHDCVGNVTYEIPITWDPGTELLIAAHGVAQTGGMNGVLGSLPTPVSMSTEFPGLGFGAPSYFDVAIGGGTFLDGTYDGYCVDTDSGRLVLGDAIAYSSYGTLPTTLRIDKPENLDLVNWLINQRFVGQPSGCDGLYTYGDLQWAIWTLLEDEFEDNGSLGDWSACRSQEIIDAALANGEGFVPGCGQKLGIIIDPVDWRQPVIIWIETPCGQDETAWAGDYFGSPLEFEGKNWAIYFSYTTQ